MARLGLREGSCGQGEWSDGQSAIRYATTIGRTASQRWRLWRGGPQPSRSPDAMHPNGLVCSCSPSATAQG